MMSGPQRAQAMEALQRAQATEGGAAGGAAEEPARGQEYRERQAADYDAAARELFKSLGLVGGDAGSSAGGKYSNLDPIWCDPRTKARVFIGNQSAAKNEGTLATHGITHIVNCQDMNAPNFHEANPAFTYLRFPVAHWIREDTETDEQVLAYFNRCFEFVQTALDGGHGVLIHCLAGAHRKPHD